jgi:hypothetical protein
MEENKKDLEEVAATPLEDLSLVTSQATDLTPESLVEQASAAATVTLIQESDEVKTKILKGAEQVVHNKTEEIKNRAERQAKKELFENNRGACGCFGFEEETTERWAVNYMKIWNRIFTLLWLIVGSVTFAPVLFISSKLKAIIKRAWVAVVLAIIIYVALLLSPLWIHLITKVRAMV